MDEPSRTKRSLRRAALRTEPVTRDAGAAARAQSRLLSLAELDRARLVALYAALPGEVPTSPLRTALEARRISVAYPRVEGSALTLHGVSTEAQAPGSGGLDEPGREERPVAVEDVDLFVVPGVLFDRRLNRLGRGGGHYDRLLARARVGAVFVGLCYAERIVERLPVEPWDQRMHVVITDRDELR